MANMVVRVFNVRFGDAVLVSIPERAGSRTVTRHLLIDVGNVNAAEEGGSDFVFEDVVSEISRLTGGEVDLYVMTHEHLDHCQGLFWAKEKKGIDLVAKNAWLTRSADPKYYDQFADAEREFALAKERYLHAMSWFAASGERAPEITAMLRNNDAFLRSTGASRTADCVDYLRQIAPRAKTFYVSRQTKLAGKHPFREAKLRVLAPEADTSSYYRRRPGVRLMAVADGSPRRRRTRRTAPNPEPPVGVDAGAFFDLVAAREGGIAEDLLAIDKAANNTSIVLELEWRGWRLLFPGDAEEKSWEMMAEKNVLRPAHFVKVGHHGSHNGTPDDEFLNLVLPEIAPDRRQRRAAVSTFDGTYGPVPDEDTLKVYGRRCDKVYDTRKLKDGKVFEIRFAG